MCSMEPGWQQAESGSQPALGLRKLEIQSLLGLRMGRVCVGCCSVHSFTVPDSHLNLAPREAEARLVMETGERRSKCWGWPRRVGFGCLRTPEWRAQVRLPRARAVNRQPRCGLSRGYSRGGRLEADRGVRRAAAGERSCRRGLALLQRGLSTRGRPLRSRGTSSLLCDRTGCVELFVRGPLRASRCLSAGGTVRPA